MSKSLYEAWGLNKSQLAFVIYLPIFSGSEKELKDNTHFNLYSAYRDIPLYRPGHPG